VAWAAKDVFNPAAIVRDGGMHLLVRAEDRVGPFAGAGWPQRDGVDFSLHPEPVLFPDGGQWHPWEWPGGCEGPRVVETPDGGYVCCYSAFDGKSSCLMAATSGDLVHWEKHGPAFATTPFARRWSKSGSIVTAVEDGRLLAARIDGRFHIYWGALSPSRSYAGRPGGPGRSGLFCRRSGPVPRHVVHVLRHGRLAHRLCHRPILEVTSAS
jgi:beta-1,2-mannosidase